MRDETRKTRILRRVTVISVLLVVACAGLIIYCLANTNLTVTARGISVYPAAEFEDGSVFYSLSVHMMNNAVPGIVYEKELLTDPNQYHFTVYTLRLKNNSLIPAETVECWTEPLPGDILMYTGEDEVIIPPGETRDVQIVLLSRNDTQGSVRTICISHYFWGHRERGKYTYAQ